MDQQQWPALRLAARWIRDLVEQHPLGDASLFLIPLCLGLEDRGGPLQEGAFQEVSRWGAEAMLAACLGRARDAGQDLGDILSLELGNELAAFLQQGASPSGLVLSLCTCPVSGAHYSWPASARP